MTATPPREMVERLQVGPDDRRCVVETENGDLSTPYGPDFHDAMSARQEEERAASGR